MEITDDHGVDYERVKLSARCIVAKPQDNWPSAGWDAYNLALACLDYEKRISALKEEIAWRDHKIAVYEKLHEGTP